MKQAKYLIPALVLSMFGLALLAEYRGGFDQTKKGGIEVCQVIDGDTIKLCSGETVRYIGVDTPERGYDREPDECYAQEAWRFNQELVGGQTVVMVKGDRSVDDYGRTLAYVYRRRDGEWVMVNQELLQAGAGKLFFDRENSRYYGQFKQAQAHARDHHLGLWSTCTLEPRGL